MAAMAAVVEAVGGVLVAVGGAATVQARAEAGAHIRLSSSWAGPAPGGGDLLARTLADAVLLQRLRDLPDEELHHRASLHHTLMRSGRRTRFPVWLRSLVGFNPSLQQGRKKDRFCD